MLYVRDKTMIEPKEIRQKIFEKMNALLDSDGYTEMTAGEIKQLAQAYQALMFFDDGNDKPSKDEDDGFGFCD